MKSYNYKHTYYGVHTVKVNLQQREFKGKAYIGKFGSVGGAHILSGIARDLEDNNLEFIADKTNKKHLIFEEGLEDNKYGYPEKVRLYKGDEMIEIDVHEATPGISHLVVGVEIVKYNLGEF